MVKPERKWVAFNSHQIIISSSITSAHYKSSLKSAMTMNRWNLRKECDSLPYTCWSELESVGISLNMSLSLGLQWLRNALERAVYLNKSAQSAWNEFFGIFELQWSISTSKDAKTFNRRCAPALQVYWCTGLHFVMLHQTHLQNHHPFCWSYNFLAFECQNDHK